MAQTEKAESTSIAGTTTTEEEPAGKKREDWRKLKELEEARKAGTAPAMQDEEGRDINPHIPQYIMQAPWYIGATQATLRHQRQPDYMKKEYNKMDDWYKKGVNVNAVATKYRKGACENCGAMTHAKKDCLERPRKLGAKFTGQDIAPDEHIQPDLGFDFEGKRDRWNGYDVEDYKRVLADFQKQEEAKRTLKALKLEKSMDGGRDDSISVSEVPGGDEEDEDDKYADDMAMPGQKFETKQRITVRNLRIREDTAKYLFNLDPNSAFYDPKTRAMRENPFEEKGLAAKDLPYAGDNFVRWSGDAQEMAKNQMFSWEAYEKGTEAHLQADPTKLEMLQRGYGKKKEEFKSAVKNSIIDKYGGQEHLDAPPKQLLIAQTENYVEYSRHGTLLRGQEKAKVKSRYEEDVYERNHTGVWGSYWREGRWGYSCCHSLIRQSYCVGRAGKEYSDNQPLDDDETLQKKTDDASDEQSEANRLLAAYDPEQPKTLLQQHLEKRVAEEKKTKRLEKKKEMKNRNKKKGKKKGRHGGSSSEEEEGEASSSSSSSEGTSSSSEDSDDDDEGDASSMAKDKVKEALKREEKRLQQVEALLSVDERKRPFNVMYDGKGPSEEDIEAFQMKRVRYEDPMANFK